MSENQSIFFRLEGSLPTGPLRVQITSAATITVDELKLTIFQLRNFNNPHYCIIVAALDVIDANGASADVEELISNLMIPRPSAPPELYGSKPYNPIQVTAMAPLDDRVLATRLKRLERYAKKMGFDEAVPVGSSASDSIDNVEKFKLSFM